jgi:hypothetical protein
MPKSKKIADEFLRMWPRDLFHIRGQQEALEKTLGRPGVYILYRGSTPYYVGKAVNLYSRLHDHSNIDSRYGNFWDMFSAFMVASDDARNDLEGILIAAMPTANGSHPKPFKRIHLTGALKKAYYKQGK